jgi:hypothetical protein
MLWIIPIAIVALIIWYALAGRKWLKSKTWAQGFFAWIEPLELALYQKSETILIGRLLSIGAFIVTFYDGLATFVRSLDLTPVTTRIFDALSIPPDMRNLSISAFIGLIGLVISWLRKRTTKPLELVAVPEAKVTPAAAVAIAQADVAKDQAVAAVAEAKAS